MQAPSMAEPRDVVLRQSSRDMRNFIVVAPAQHLAASVYPRQGLAVGQRDVEPHDAGVALEPALDQFEQPIAALARRGR